MRRSHGGWLAALVLLVGGCGSGPTGDDAAPPTGDRIVVPTVPVVARAPAAPAGADELTVLVSSAGGVDSPALDALATVLEARPGMSVVVVATASPNGTVGETGVSAALIDSQTVSGLPARAVNASAADAVVAALAAAHVPSDDPDDASDRGGGKVPGGRGIDLVVIGVDSDAAVGDDVNRSPAAAASRAAAARGVPAIAVTASDEHGIDLSAAVLALQHVLDLQLDGLLDHGGAHVLTVPSCATGTMRPLVEVDVGRGPAPAADCTAVPGHDDDDVAAHAAGHATVTRLR